VSENAREEGRQVSPVWTILAIVVAGVVGDARQLDRRRRAAWLGMSRALSSGLSERQA
jgi:hypothetical protein